MKDYTFFKTLAIGMAIVSFCTVIAIAGYILATQKNQSDIKNAVTCGGIADIKCAKGYYCKLRSNQPDDTGTCQKSLRLPF